MQTTLSLYQQSIQKIVPDLDPAHVEAYMRMEYGTLDGISPAQFKACAKRAASDVRLDPEFAAEVAASYGF